MSAAIRMLLGLSAGLAAGILTSLLDVPWMRTLASFVEPIGTIFINAIRMTVIPLIVSKLILGVASAPDSRTVGRLGGATLLLIIVTVTLAATASVVVGNPAMARLPVDPQAADSLRESASAPEEKNSEKTGRGMAVQQWLTDLVPANVFRAAAEGAILPLIIFSLATGLALTRLETVRRQAMLQLLHAVADTMLALVRWILLAAPVGVFALVLPLAARLGFAAAEALLYYVALVALGCGCLAALWIYPGAVLGGGVSLGTFARAAAPVQAIAFSSRSSLASLPVMMDAARARLGIREEVVAFVLPLTASMFRAGTAVGLSLGAIFLARLYAVDLGAGTMLSIILTVIVTSLGSPGIPSGSILVIVPILMAGGIPIEGAGILLGIDTLPDMLRTTTNVTADLGAAAVIDRRWMAGRD